MSRLSAVVLAVLAVPCLAAEDGRPRSVTSAGWTISWTDSRAVASKGADKVVLYTQEEETEGCESELSGKVISAAGPLVSVLYTEQGYCEGAAHRGSITLFKTVDLSRGGKSVALTELFGERAVVSALLQDRVVQKAIRASGAPAPRSLKELQSLEGGCEMSFYGVGGASFALHHVKDGKVAVRVGLPYGCEAMRDNFTQLGVYFPIPEPLRASLREAEAAGTLGNVLMKQK